MQVFLSVNMSLVVRLRPQTRLLVNEWKLFKIEGKGYSV